MKQILVKDVYHNLRRSSGSDIAERFLSLMVEWDGSKTVWGAYYDPDVLRIKVREAKDIIYN